MNFIARQVLIQSSFYMNSETLFPADGCIKFHQVHPTHRTRPPQPSVWDQVAYSDVLCVLALAGIWRLEVQIKANEIPICSPSEGVWCGEQDRNWVAEWKLCVAEPQPSLHTRVTSVSTIP